MLTGLLAVSAFSAYMWVSAAPVKVPLQTAQPSIAKVGVKPIDAKGKGSLSMQNWSGKPIFIKYSPTVKSYQMYAQTTNISSKVPTWYAFDVFSIITDKFNATNVEQLIKDNAPTATSSDWQKARSAKLPSFTPGEDQYYILVAYVSNADSKSVPGAGIVDSFAYIVIEPEISKPLAVGNAELSFMESSDSIQTQQFVMGQINQPFFKFKASAGPLEDVKLQQVMMQMNFSSDEPSAKAPVMLGAVKNLKLYEGDKVLGSTVAGLVAVKAAGKNAGELTFKNIDYVIPKGESRTFTVVGDLAAAPDMYSGVQFTTLLNPVMKLIDGSKGILADGVVSGAPAKIVASKTILSSQMYMYKTKLAIATAVNSPSGAASKGSQQIVARFVVQNAANVNNQSGKIEKMILSGSTTMEQPAGTKRMLKLYKGDYPISSNLIGTYEYSSKTCLFGSSLSCVSAVFDVAKGAEFPEIESGSSQSFTVTFDSVDASANNTLRFDATITRWTDGQSQNIIESFPLLKAEGKQLIY